MWLPVRSIFLAKKKKLCLLKNLFKLLKKEFEQIEKRIHRKISRLQYLYGFFISYQGPWVQQIKFSPFMKFSHLT